MLHSIISITHYMTTTVDHFPRVLYAYASEISKMYGLIQRFIIICNILVVYANMIHSNEWGFNLAINKCLAFSAKTLFSLICDNNTSYLIHQMFTELLLDLIHG